MSLTGNVKQDVSAVRQQPAAQVTRPQSATALLTGLVGLVAAVVAFLALRGVVLLDYQKTLLVIAAVAGAMMAVDAGFFGALRGGLSRAPVRGVAMERVVRKLVGFWATIGALAFAYWLLPEYAGTFYGPAWAAARAVAPWLVVISPFYIAYVDRRQPDPDDAYAQIGALIFGGRSPNGEVLGQHVRGWLVKGFFLPLMFAYLNNDLRDTWAASFVFDNPWQLYERLYSILFLVDVLFACIGYLCTLRLFDTQIRSTEPTLFGWLVCILCYQPFWGLIGNNYINYDSDGLTWGGAFGGASLFATVWGVAILLCVVVYATSTVVFGLRFSNLTNRGIITTGPYRWIKHPAYVSKNLSWWLISVPFISFGGWELAVKQSILLAAMNAIYVMRAYTEERHMARDPDYRAYQDFIRRDGLVARVRRAIGRARG